MKNNVTPKLFGTISGNTHQKYASLQFVSVPDDHGTCTSRATSYILLCISDYESAVYMRNVARGRNVERTVLSQRKLTPGTASLQTADSSQSYGIVRWSTHEMIAS